MRKYLEVIVSVFTQIILIAILSVYLGAVSLFVFMPIGGLFTTLVDGFLLLLHIGTPDKIFVIHVGYEVWGIASAIFGSFFGYGLA